MSLQTFQFIQSYLADATNQPPSDIALNPSPSHQFNIGDEIMADDGNTSGAVATLPDGVWTIPWQFVSQMNPNPTPTPTPNPTPSPNHAPAPNKQPTASNTDAWVIGGLAIALVGLYYTFRD